jgi:hypothetical protein
LSEAKPINASGRVMGIASLNPSYAASRLCIAFSGTVNAACRYLALVQIRFTLKANCQLNPALSC